MANTFTFQTIAIARTPFQEKFGIPRQSGLVDLPGTIELLPPWSAVESVRGLEEVSHLWLHFIFSEHLDHEPSLSVRPPRLGGNRRIGVFASRSSYRPNPIGMSLVKLDAITQGKQGVELLVSGIDLLDGTPIIDIKPYLPYADHCAGAVNRIASAAPADQRLSLCWSLVAKEQLQVARPEDAARVGEWIAALIRLDPRPAYRAGEEDARYGMKVFGLDVHWRMISADCAEITAVQS